MMNVIGNKTKIKKKKTWKRKNLEREGEKKGDTRRMNVRRRCNENRRKQYTEERTEADLLPRKQNIYIYKKEMET